MPIELEAVEGLPYVCGGCGAVGARQKCLGCHSVRYCGRQCQVAHWPLHKNPCRRLKAEHAAYAAEAAFAFSAEANWALGAEEEEEEVDVEEAGNCWTCGTDNPRILCNSCKVAEYCDESCQTENCKTHKARCPILKGYADVVDATKSDLKKVKAGVRRSQQDLMDLLCHASMLGRIADIERIIAAGGRLNSDSKLFRPLIWAAQEGHARAIGVLVRHGAQVNARNQQDRVALNQAAQNGHLRAAAALLEHGAQIDLQTCEGMSSLYIASQFNHVEVMDLLLRKGANIDLKNKRGGFPLGISCEAGKLAAARLLLQHGAKIDSRTNDGISPLYLATQENHPEIVALLLEAGAQVDLPNKDGTTSLSIAAQRGHTAVARLLLEHGAQVDMKNGDGRSPLFYAAHSNNPDIVALLLGHGAEVDITDPAGWTPCFVSAVQGFTACVRLLLQAGANPLHETSDGYTAIIAATNKHPEVMALLQSRIAEIVRSGVMDALYSTR